MLDNAMHIWEKQSDNYVSGCTHLQYVFLHQNSLLTKEKSMIFMATTKRVFTLTLPPLPPSLPRNNIAYLGSFAKVSIPIHSIISRYLLYFL